MTTLREAAEQALEAWDKGTHSVVEALNTLRAALAEPDGWRQCAVGQKTTQYCGLLEEAVKAEREACARVCEQYAEHQQQWRNESAEFRAMGANEAAEAIRARGIDHEAETL